MSHIYSFNEFVEYNKSFEEFIVKFDKSLLNEDVLIIESLITSKDIVGRFKEMVRKGTVTAAIVASLLASQNITASEKSEINKIATEQGVQTLNTQVFKVNGYAKSMDQEVAKKKAISDARNKGALEASKVLGDKEFNITNSKELNVKFEKQADGTYMCGVQLSFEVTPV